MHETFGNIEELKEVERIHLMGIGGSGMSALALLLTEAGFKVDGCDLSRSAITARLEGAGIACPTGHSPSHIEEFSPQLLIYSGAVPPLHEELTAAREKGIRTVTRAAALSWLFNASRGVGVAGTHGKTTTSSMIAWVLKDAGYDPTLAIGAEVCDLGTNARVGKNGLFVAELDESDGSFEFFKPAVTVITNADWDHVNYFHSRGDVISAFVRFAQGRKPQTPLIICGEDEGSQAVIQALTQALRSAPESLGSGADSQIVTYGWGKSWDWGAFDAVYREGGGVTFSVACDGDFLGDMELAVSGDHNIMNALAASAAASSLGISFDETKRALAGFHGARRRLEKIGQKDLRDLGDLGGSGIVEVFDDYAHHPTEIAASLSAMRSANPGRRLVAAFQPHRYTRTRAFYREFARALAEADVTLLMPVYAAGEPEQEITSADIFERMTAEGCRSILCSSEEDALRELDSLLRGGEIFLTLGAGDIFRLGEAYLK